MQKLGGIEILFDFPSFHSRLLPTCLLSMIL